MMLRQELIEQFLQLSLCNPRSNRLNLQRYKKQMPYILFRQKLNLYLQHSHPEDYNLQGRLKNHPRHPSLHIYSNHLLQFLARPMSVKLCLQMCRSRSMCQSRNLWSPTSRRTSLPL